MLRRVPIRSALARRQHLNHHLNNGWQATTAASSSSPSMRWASSSSLTSSKNIAEAQQAARLQQRQMRRWFDTVISLGAHPLDHLTAVASAPSPPQQLQQTQSGAGITPNPWLHAVVSPMAKEARAILKALQNANALGVDLPDSIVNALWSVFDRLYLVRYRDLTVEEKLALEARQYEYFLLMSQAGTDMGKIDELATRIKKEAAALLSKELDTTSAAITAASTSSSSSHNGTTTTLVRLVEELRGAAMPLFHRWLKQSAATSHIISDAAAEEDHEYEMHERLGGRVRVGGALGLPGAHGVQKIIMLRAALLKAMSRLEGRRRNKTLGVIIAGANNGTSATNTTAAEADPAVVAKWYEERKAAMEVLNNHCFALLKQWMKHGEGIVMREMRWDNTPPSILEKVVAAEVVHPFAFPALSAMRLRMQPTGRRRHLFCFFHEGIGYDEPLIAVQVALTKGISNSVDGILGRPTAVGVPESTDALPAKMMIGSVSSGSVTQAAHNNNGVRTTTSSSSFDTAIFYSINSTQVGLKGVDLGNSLIKAVVKHLQTVYPQLTTFSTLSPIPMYAHWLKGEVRKVTKALGESPDYAALLAKKGDGDVNNGTTGASFFSDEHLQCVVDAIIASNANIFGQRVRHGGGGGGPSSSAGDSDNPAAPQSTIAAVGSSSSPQHPTLSSAPNAEPSAPIDAATMLQWLKQVREALEKISAESASTTTGSCPTSVTPTATSASSSNILEALVHMLSPPRPSAASSSSLSSTEVKKQRKVNPIAAIHVFPSATAAGGGGGGAARKGWWEVEGVSELLQTPLTHSITCYLATEKTNGRITDPVGNFHVSNGAVLWRVNWMGNQTVKGSQESACAMVNYWYDLEGNAANARGYELGRTVAVGTPIQQDWERVLVH